MSEFNILGDLAKLADHEGGKAEEITRLRAALTEIANQAVTQVTLGHLRAAAKAMGGEDGE